MAGHGPVFRDRSASRYPRRLAHSLVVTLDWASFLDKITRPYDSRLAGSIAWPGQGPPPQLGSSETDETLEGGGLSAHSRGSLAVMTTDLFPEACGAHGPLYFEVEGVGGGVIERRVYSQPFALIGRDARVDLLLDHDRVSRRHAYLQMIDGHVYCVDLGSRTGVRWEDDRRARSGWLREGRPVRIGPFTLRRPASDRDRTADAEDSTEPQDPFQSQAPGPVSLPDVVLEFRDRDGTSPLMCWRMTRRLALVGNAPECQVRFQDKSVSRFHCSLLRTSMGLWAVDLLGREGIALNGLGVRVARLEDGDELRIGRVAIDVRYDAATADDVHQDRTSSETRTLVRLASDPTPPLGSFEVAIPPGSSPTRPGAVPANVAGAGGDVSVEGVYHPPGDQRYDVAGFGDPSLPYLADQMLLMNQSMMESFGRTVMMMFQEIRDLHSDELRLLREELDRVQRLSVELVSLKADRALTPPADARPPGATSGVDRKSDVGRAAPPAGPASAPEKSDAPAPPIRPKIPDRSASRSEDAQAWLCERIAAIQDEQQGRWRKVLNLIQNKSRPRGD